MEMTLFQHYNICLKVSHYEKYTGFLSCQLHNVLCQFHYLTPLSKVLLEKLAVRQETHFIQAKGSLSCSVVHILS